MNNENYWGDFLSGGDYEKEFDKYLKEKVAKRANDAEFFIDVLIEQGIINLERDKIKEYFVKWFIENKEFDLQIENGDFAMEDNDIKFVPDFSKDDIVNFIKWFEQEKNTFLDYLKNEGVEVKNQKNENINVIVNSNDVSINNGNITNNQPANSGDKKNKWEKGTIISLIGVIGSITGLFLGTNLVDRFTKTENQKTEILTAEISVGENSTILDSLELPYLENVPIIDKGIYIKYDYNNLRLGGVNIDSIKINARSKDGEKMELVKSESNIEMRITSEPYIEFEYKGIIYSIEILGQHYSFNCIIKKNIKSSMNLIEYYKI